MQSSNGSSGQKQKQDSKQVLGNNVASSFVQPAAMSMQLMGKPTMRDLNRYLPRRTITHAGQQFLEAAFASVDFPNMGSFSGIPDGSPLNTVAYRHLYLKNSADIFKPWTKEGTQYCILLAPTPGVAFWVAENVDPTAGITSTTIWHAIVYDDFDDLFQTPSKATEQVTKFRYASNWFELVPAMNALSWTGNITVKKFSGSLVPCPAYTNGGSSVTYSMQVTGMESCNSTSIPTFVAPMNQGAYVCTLNNTRTFEYSNVLEDYDSINNGNSSAYTNFENSFRGWGNLECALITLTTNYVVGPGQGQLLLPNFFIRAGASVEYVPQGNGIIHKMATPSPPLDEAALDAYHMISRNMPVAVDYFHNAGFWDDLWDGIKKVFKFAGDSNLPVVSDIGKALGTAAKYGEQFINWGNDLLRR